MTIEELIKIANDAYSELDDMVLRYFEDPTGEHGDSLAKFVCVELSETFDADGDEDDQYTEAIRAMLSAQRQLQDVVSALESASCQ